LASKSK
jgi:hypothetical protein